MHKIASISELKATVSQWRKQELSIAFVPTMGNLHAGHIKLVREARKKADKVIVSIFVNPTQFCVGEDFESYPRTELADQDKLEKASTDLLFLPSVFEIYQSNATTTISVGGLSKMHCGAHRVGHFDGVATIVTKLFNMVQPDLAIFGEKDFQQLAVIRIMVQELNIPVEILGVATEREDDGLALSSRNGYLSSHERSIAPVLYQALCQAREEILQGQSDFQLIEDQQKKRLQVAGFQVDYFSICKTDDLHIATEKDDELVILAAAKLGKPRLIDNVCFSKNKVTTQ